MISWIQKYFQHHIRLVMFIMLLIIGLPMVFIYSQSSGLGHGDVRVREQKFFNVNLANAEQARHMMRDAELSVYLRAGYPALQAAQLQSYALQRVAGLALAERLSLPEPTADQLSKHTAGLGAFQNQQGQFDPSAYTRFGDSLRSAGSPFTVADVNRVLREDTRLAEVGKVIGGPGYVLPAHVRQQLARIDSTWTIQVAELDYNGFNPPINPTDADLQKFHDENAFRYEVPPRPRFSVVDFKAAEFTPAHGPTEEEMRAFYNTNSASFPVPADPEKKDPALTTPPADNFPKVRAQVETAMLNLASRRLASEAANDFTVALFERKLAPNSAELASHLTGLRRNAAPVAPFAPGSAPADRPWLDSYAEAISRLNAERPFSDALPTPDGFAVLLWNESLPGYKPLFADVRDRVLADYRENEKRRLFVARGADLKSKLQAAASTPAGFADKAAAEKLTVKSYANFTLRQPPQDLPPAAFGAMSSLAPGKVSDLLPSADKGIIVYAQEKKLPDLTPANPRYAEIQGQLMLMASGSNESSYLGELVTQELGKTDPAALR